MDSWGVCHSPRTENPAIVISHIRMDPCSHPFSPLACSKLRFWNISIHSVHPSGGNIFSVVVCVTRRLVPPPFPLPSSSCGPMCERCCRESFWNSPKRISPLCGGGGRDSFPLQISSPVSREEIEKWGLQVPFWSLALTSHQYPWET